MWLRDVDPHCCSRSGEYSSSFFPSSSHHWHNIPHPELRRRLALVTPPSHTQLVFIIFIGGEPPICPSWKRSSRLLLPLLCHSVASFLATPSSCGPYFPTPRAKRRWEHDSSSSAVVHQDPSESSKNRRQHKKDHAITGYTCISCFIVSAVKSSHSTTPWSTLI